MEELSKAFEELVADEEPADFNDILKGQLHKVFDFNEKECTEINRELYSLGVYLLSLARLFPLTEEEIRSSFSHLSAQPKNVWIPPNNIPNALQSFLNHVNGVITHFNLPLKKVTEKIEEKTEQKENQQKQLLRMKQHKDLFSDDDDLFLTPTQDPEEDVTQNDIDMWWGSVSTDSSRNSSKAPTKKELEEIDTLLQENLDYKTLGEDLESEFLKIRLGNEEDEEEEIEEAAEVEGDDIESALSFVLGSEHSISRVPKGKVDPKAVDRASHRIMMSALDGSDDDETVEMEGNILEEYERMNSEGVYHDDYGIELSGEEEEEEAVPVVEVSEEDAEEYEEEGEVVIEYVDEDGNPIEGYVEGDVEYEYVYEQVSEEELVSEDDVAEDPKSDDDFAFDDDLDDMDAISSSTAATTSWNDLLADL